VEVLLTWNDRDCPDPYRAQIKEQSQGEHYRLDARKDAAGIAQGWGDDRVLAFLQDQAINDPEPPTRAAALRAIAQRWYS
jgi:hypothetical protein